MDCQWIRARFSAYLDDELCPLDEKKIEKHLKYCRQCREEWIKFCKVQNFIVNLPEVYPPGDFSHEVIKRASARRSDNLPAKSLQYLKGMFAQFNFISIRKVAVAFIVILLLGNGVIFSVNEAFYGKSMAEADEHKAIDITEEQMGLVEEHFKGILLYRTVGPTMSQLNGDVHMTSTTGEGPSVDVRQYQEAVEADEHRRANWLYWVFNGVMVPFFIVTIGYFWRKT